jgi:glycosyltransferase involved in cell wall biosynthesis
LRINIKDVFGHSLREINKDIIEFLSNHYTINSVKSDVLIQHYLKKVPDRNSYKKCVLIQPVDGTKFYKQTINEFNNYDLIITPSTKSERILIDNGVISPISVIPNYYYTDLLDSDNSYFNDKFGDNNKYTFYSETTGIPRKNVINIIKHFNKTFNNKDNVRLVIKISEGRYHNDIENLIKMNENSPEVIIIRDFLSIDELMSIRKGIDCYICLSYMEGFCIPLLYAAVLKKDIICFDSKISGYMDFINSDNACLIKTFPIQIDQSFDSVLIYSKDSDWEDIDYKDYKAALKIVYNGDYKFNKNQDYSKFSIESVMNEYLLEMKIIERLI